MRITLSPKPVWYTIFILTTSSFSFLIEFESLQNLFMKTFEAYIKKNVLKSEYRLAPVSSV